MMPAFPFEVQAFFYAHHFSLYLLIRLFSGIGYSVGTSESYRTKCVDENRFQALKIKG